MDDLFTFDQAQESTSLSSTKAECVDVRSFVETTASQFRKQAGVPIDVEVEDDVPEVAQLQRTCVMCVNVCMYVCVMCV